MLGSLPDFLLVVLGFGLIVFLHELGHFVAARWAGIRVLAFAVGFGPALLSYRKGLGIRRGSTEAQYNSLTETGDPAAKDLSPTEYRLNMLPFGGYVKMLGQEDGDPTAVSDAADSFQRCAPWKRLIVISAGVVMNIITAAALFVMVFMIGMKVEPARVGSVVAGSPAATTPALNAHELRIIEPGLLPGDRVIAVNGEQPRSFNDLILATAMADKDVAVRLTVSRTGYEQPLEFQIRPREGPTSGLLELGIEPSRSAQLLSTTDDTQKTAFGETMAKLGLRGVNAGMTLVSVDGVKASDANDLFAAVRRSNGGPIEVRFTDGSGAAVTATASPRPQFQLDHLPRPNNAVAPVDHLLGLMPVMTVGATTKRAEGLGLKDGDIFARLGSVEYPAIPQGIAEIQAHKGRSIPVVVLRMDEATKAWKEVSLSGVTVDSKGRIGFGVSDTSRDSVLVALPFATLRHPAAERAEGVQPADFTPPANSVIASPGTRILAVNDRPVANFAELRAALRAATEKAFSLRAPQATISLTLRPPQRGIADDSGPTQTVQWQLNAADMASLHQLGWDSPISADFFEPEQVLLKAHSPSEALSMGIAETRRVMLTTYVTFLRLAQGSVKIEHLKGPVGIAHLGTLVAGRGFIWLLFFLALISVNLAVINFLPLPIVDGGQFLFIVFEAVRGRPVPMAIQSAATVAGLVLIGCVFLVVTYNDIRNLLGL